MTVKREQKMRGGQPKTTKKSTRGVGIAMNYKNFALSAFRQHVDGQIIPSRGAERVMGMQLPLIDMEIVPSVESVRIGDDIKERIKNIGPISAPSWMFPD